MADAELTPFVHVFELATEKLTRVISEVVALSRDSSPQVVQLKLQQLEADAEETRRALYGSNGDKAGLIGAVAIVQEKIKAVDDAQKSLQKILVGMAVAVLTTLIGVGINIMLTMATR